MAISKAEYYDLYNEVREVTTGDYGEREAVIASFVRDVLATETTEEDAVENLLGAHASVNALVDGYGLLETMETED